MPRKPTGIDQLFLDAEQLASEFSLFPGSDSKRRIGSGLLGVLDDFDIAQRLKKLRNLDVDAYVSQTVAPSEDQQRPGARQVVRKLDCVILREIEKGPLYAAEIRLDFGPGVGERRIGIIAQERTSNMGVWMPEHHLKAVDIIREFTHYNLPIVTLIDTPGADAGEQANRQNQAHAISRLIAEFAQIDMPTVGIVLGNGYSGGAIPLATTNILLSVRDGVFNTIQPRGLASIARKYDLSWQECAKYVGVSSYELYTQGYVDAIIDYSPAEREGTNNLKQAITSSIIAVENRACTYVGNHDEIFDHYRRSVDRYLSLRSSQDGASHPAEEAMRLCLAPTPTTQANLFGLVYRYLRYLGLRRRIRSQAVESYGRLSEVDIPQGEFSQRQEQARQEAFRKWLGAPMAIRYDDDLNRAWKTFLTRKGALGESRSRLGKLLRGDPAQNFRQSVKQIRLLYGFSLYNLWKDAAQGNFLSLIAHLEDDNVAPPRTHDQMSVLDVLLQPELRPGAIRECQNLVIFDLLYDNIIQNLRSVAREANETNTISQESVRRLLEESLEKATQELLKNDADTAAARSQNQLRRQFLAWLVNFIKQDRRGVILKGIEEWKKIAYPRVSETLFAIITFFFENLLPQLFEERNNTYVGQIKPRNIAIKDFWNRLTIAYHDLLIQDVLARDKKKKQTSPKAFIETFFNDFREMNGNLMTSDPVAFPGFRLSIEQALDAKIAPCGIITGTAKLRSRNSRRRVGVVISNLAFQAGAFDMASSEKFCKLLVECARRRLPVVCFLSSGGMQTKEGAGSLFSMAIVNDRITRFVRDNDLPIIVFGFGDCTGGAQASLVTHPLVHTFYFSGTNMPFAGQIVVPSYLPYASTLSNYLSDVDGAMQGLVVHPFNPGIDAELLAIDAKMPVARETCDEVISRVLKGEFDSEHVEEGDKIGATQELQMMTAYKKVLLHARGCSAVKILRKAQEKGIPVVLVQSDPDMESVPADMIGPNDQLICIGGNSPDESYLNAKSVLHIAAREGCDALHPGIGFLSENPDFATLCRLHGVNFIGPPTDAMQFMGNKSNAINTAKRLNIPVVPGSHGIVTHVDAARQIAAEIGYPIVIKAVHGGGGKGIVMVDREEDLQDSFQRICAEARAAFGSSDVYIEKCITELRHIEVQILRDKYGCTKVLGLRDCTVQRGNQKIIEESDSVLITEELRETAYTAAGRIADEIGYVGAGTVEFIFDLKQMCVYFMEMNTRLQVEHPVTERVTGVDIVGTQFDIGAGASIADLEPVFKGYAIEVRITAERATIESGGDVSFVPDPGEVTECILPKKKHVDLIACIDKGKVVSPYYDSMVAQIICFGKDREDTVEKLLAYLDTVKIEGICTNIPLLKRILRDEQFRGGNYTTAYLKGFLKRIDIPAMIEEIEATAGIKREALTLDSLRIAGSDEIKVLAPSTGVFYTSPSPNDPAFLSEGSVMTVNQTLCLLEAMKVFRPLNLARFNQSGTVLYDPAKKYKIVRIIPASATAVSAGDLLFVVRPV